MVEQLYIFVDKSGHCFEDFQSSAGDEPSPERDYRDTIGSWLRRGKRFTVGDMMCFKQDLLDAGFVWGKDFYVRKVEGESSCSEDEEERVMPFGKYKGKAISECPVEYLDWLIGQEWLDSRFV